GPSDSDEQDGSSRQQALGAMMMRGTDRPPYRWVLPSQARSARRQEIEGDLHYLNLFAVMVGATSKGPKGTAWGRVRQYYELADADWVAHRILPGLSSGEGLIWAVRDPIVKQEKAPRKAGEPIRYEQVEVDPGVKDKRLLALEPEFASVLRRIDQEGSSLSALMRLAWDTGRLNTLTKNSPATATDAHISI